MALQKCRPVDPMQHMMTSFKHFEKMLGKLQDDMNYQGRTLSDLRLMVMNLSSGTIVSADPKSEEALSKRPQNKKTAAIQYEDLIHNYPDPNKPKRKDSMLPLPAKLKAKSFQNQKSKRLSSLDSPFQAQLYKLEAGQVHMQRHRKAEATRKTNMRTQKISTAKKNNLSK